MNAANGLSTILRVDEEIAIVAAARSQSGKVLESVPVTVAVTKDENEAITLEDGMITADAVGTAEITASSEIAGISGKLTVTVTLPVDKIVFMEGDNDGPSELNLAAGETYAEITAVAHNKDGEVVPPRSNWTWKSTDTSVATVAQLVMMGAKAKITGVGSGEATIMATVEDVTGSIDVRVTGQSITREIVASAANNGNSLVWDRGLDTAGYTDNQNTTVFDVNLRDVASRDLITAWTLTVTPAAPGAADANTNVTVGAVGGSITTDGTIPVTVALRQLMMQSMRARTKPSFP